MKRAFCTVFVSAFIFLLAAQSCTVKRDCKGRVKHRLSNGIWI